MQTLLRVQAPRGLERWVQAFSFLCDTAVRGPVPVWGGHTWPWALWACPPWALPFPPHPSAPSPGHHHSASSADAAREHGGVAAAHRGAISGSSGHQKEEGRPAPEPGEPRGGWLWSGGRCRTWLPREWGRASPRQALSTAALGRGSSRQHWPSEPRSHPLCVRDLLAERQRGAVVSTSRRPDCLDLHRRAGVAGCAGVGSRSRPVSSSVRTARMSLPSWRRFWEDLVSQCLPRPQNSAWALLAVTHHPKPSLSPPVPLSSGPSVQGTAPLLAHVALKQPCSSLHPSVH